MVIDGQETVDLGTSVTLAISRHENPALFVDIRRNFFEKVDKKLRRM
jgi:NAD+ kinase